jgi:hypothetical protein
MAQDQDTLSTDRVVATPLSMDLPAQEPLGLARHDRLPEVFLASD